MQDEGLYKTIVFDPPKAASLTIEALEDLQKNRDRGVHTGIVGLDNVLLPMLPSELITIIGYTSWYKSGFMNWVAKHALENVKENEVVIKVTWEQSIEEDTLVWIANNASISISMLAKGEYSETDWKMVMGSYKQRILTPLWIVGHSSKESEAGHRARPRMTMTDVQRALDFICKGATDKELKIRLIVLDYLQRIRPDPQDGSTKREQMMEAVNRSKDTAIQFGCPVMLGVQASRDVLNRNFKLPRLDDGLETSNIEQSSDKVISLWYPIKTEEEGAIVMEKPVNKNLLICGLLKQKMGVAPVTAALFVDPEKNIIGSLADDQFVAREDYTDH